MNDRSDLRGRHNVVPFRRPFRAVPLRRVVNRPARVARSTWGQAAVAMRPWLLLIALVTIAFCYTAAGVFEAPAALQTAPQSVNARFVPCGTGWSPYCAIDGDTIKIGRESVRIVGIDTPEKDSGCPAEATNARVAAGGLLRWRNRGPFVMTARLDHPTDRYGRALRTLKRANGDGTFDNVADHMRNSGLARRYDGGLRAGWC